MTGWRMGFALPKSKLAVVAIHTESLTSCLLSVSGESVRSSPTTPATLHTHAHTRMKVFLADGSPTLQYET